MSFENNPSRAVQLADEHVISMEQWAIRETREGKLQERIAALEAELAESRKFESVCYCGTPISQHYFKTSECLSTPMDEPCPNAAKERIAALEAELAKAREPQELIGTVFMFPDQFADFHNRYRVQFHRMNSPFYAGEKWCVRQLGDCLNRDAQWEWEVKPSSRDVDFYSRCRFSSLEEAVTTYKRSLSSLNGGKIKEVAP